MVRWFITLLMKHGTLRGARSSRAARSPLGRPVRPGGWWCGTTPPPATTSSTRRCAGSPTPREAALISLLDAAGQVPKVLAGSGVDRRELRRRARGIATGEFAGAAVRRAIDAVTAATMIAVSGGAVAASGGG